MPSLSAGLRGIEHGKPSMRMVALFLVMSTTGCTSLSLQRESLQTTDTAMDIRYREVVENLALIANNPATLPTYASIFSGTIQITDSAGLGSATTWQSAGAATSKLNGFQTMALSPALSRNTSSNWSLDPIIAPEKLEAMRSACQWVLYGPEFIPEHCLHLLTSPEQDRTFGRHFGVVERLNRMPAGWLHVGCHADVPRHALYKSHAGKTWVWVMPEGLEGLSEFTLILQDIAWVSINSLSLYDTPTPPFVLTRTSGPKDANEKDQRVVSVRATVKTEKDKTDLAEAEPYRQLRFDNRGTASALRSQIAAAGSP